ncbi:MAG: chain length determinant protein EpsF [Pseudomonadota bacterium]
MNNLTFSQIFRTLRGRWKLCFTIFFGIVGVCIAVTAAMTEKYTATATVLLDVRGADPVSGATVPGQLFPSYLATQLDLMSSLNVALKVVDTLKIDTVPEVQTEYMRQTEGRGTVRDWAAAQLLKYLKLEPTRDSSVVRITYTSPDPRFSAVVANTFAQSYIRTTLELRVDPAKETSAWFDSQLKTLKTNLEQAQAKLSEYQQKNGIVASDERIDAENTRLQDLTARLVLAQEQTYSGVSKQRQITAAQSRGTENAAPDVLANPVIQRLKSEIAQAQARITTLSSTVGTSHPQYQSAQENLQSLTRQFDDEMRTISSGVRNVTALAQQNEGSLRAALNAQREKLLDIKKQRSEMVTLQGEAESAQRAYDAGLQRLTQTRMESQLNQTNVSIVTPATEPVDPSRPRWILHMLLAVILGINAAIGMALMRERADRRIRSISDLLDEVPAPLLGELMPMSRPKRRLALLPRFGGRLSKA